MATNADALKVKGKQIEFAGLLRSETFILSAAIAVAVLFAFWPFVRLLPTRWWFADDTYYAHGAIVPLCAAFIVYDRWGRIKNIPVKGFWPALIPLGALLYFSIMASRTELWAFTGGGLDPLEPGQEPLQAAADRVDVPCGDLDSGHWGRCCFSWAATIRACFPAVGPCDLRHAAP